MNGERGVVEARPPVWAEKFVRFSLRARDRDTVTGDLLEEYRENVLPKRGPFGACLWYVRQALSFLIRNPVRFAIVVGIVFGVWNIAYSLLFPLAEDTAAALLGFYGPMFFMPGVAA